MADDHPTTDSDDDDEYDNVSSDAGPVTEPDPVPSDDDEEPAKQGD